MDRREGGCCSRSPSRRLASGKAYGSSEPRETRACAGRRSLTSECHEARSVRRCSGIIPLVDTWLAIASKRDTRNYSDTAIPADVERRILEAGRVSGSSRNTQKWEFVVVERGRQELAAAVYAP